MPDQRIDASGPDVPEWSHGAYRERLRGASSPRGPHARLRLRTTAVGFREVLTVAGAVDDTTVDMLRQALNRLLKSSGGEVWIDLSSVTVLDGTAIRALADIAAALERRHRRLALIAPAGPALESLQREKADGRFEIFAGRAEAHYGCR